MKFSYSWLTEHLKTNAHFEEIEKKLTSIGLEVEDIQDMGKAYQAVSYTHLRAHET